MRVLVATAALSGLVGCSLLVPLDAASEDDASSDDAGAPDASTAVVDAPPPPPVDAAPPPVTEAGSPCLPNSILCDDFERAGVLTPSWSSVFGTPSTSTLRAVSPTRSLLTSLKANDTAHGITKQIAQAPARMHMRFHVFMPTAPGSFVEILKLPYGPVNNWDAFTVSVAPEGLSVGAQYYENSGTPKTIVGQQLLDATGTFGAWHRLDLVFDLSKSPKTLTTTIDTMAPYVLELPSARALSGGVTIIVGPGYHEGTAKDFDAFFDDFTIAPP